MKKTGLASIALLIAATALAFVSSCIQLKPNNNPNDPTSKEYNPPAGSNAKASGWKMDSTAGTGGSSCLRCVNVPMGEFRMITFPMGSWSGGTPTFATKEGSNTIKTISGGGLWYKVTISNTAAASEKISWTQNLGANVANLTPYFSSIFMDPATFTGPANNVSCIIMLSNISDSDGTNVFYIDDVAFGFSTGTWVGMPFGFSSLSDSSLTGDKEK